jgi:Ca2+-binding RTX toxin-like protein
VWKTVDGQFEYRLQGTDLKVTEVATGIELTINENFQSGQLGITLRDAPANPLYDDGRPVLTITSLVPEVDDNHNYIFHAPGGGVGTIAPKSGNDQIYGSNVGELITGGYGHDRLYGGDGNDTMLGGSYFLLQEGDPKPTGMMSWMARGAMMRSRAMAGMTVCTAVPGTTDCLGIPARTAHTFRLRGGDDLLAGGAGDDMLLGYGNDGVVLGGKDQLMRNGVVKLALTQ